MACVPLLLLTTTVRLCVNNINTYEYSFSQYDVSQVTGINETQLSTVAERLIDYFNFRVETPQVKVVQNGEEIELFQENDRNCELTHLGDVRSLFRLDYLVQWVTLAYIVIYALFFVLWRKGRWQHVLRGITRGCVLTIALLAILGIASIFAPFEQAFIQFHYLVFHNQCWMSTGYLPRLFPEGFWKDVALFAGAAIAAEALLLGSIAWGAPFIYYRRQRSHKQ